MKQMTLHIPDELKEYIEDVAEEQEQSQSKVARELLERGTEHEELRNEVDRLRNQLEAMSERNDVEDRLVRYVEQDMQWHEAGLATKARWFLFGRD
jgi:predicted transcriptional regulator